jgi:hypothetical protein
MGPFSLYKKEVMMNLVTKKQQSWSNIRVHGGTNILWHADPLLGGKHKTGDCTVVLARQQPANKGMVFSAWSMPRCYK